MPQRRKRYFDTEGAGEVPGSEDTQDTQQAVKRRKGKGKGSMPAPSAPVERPQDELDIYLSEATVNVAAYSSDPVAWWRDIGAKRFPRLSYMAVDFLTIPSSTAETERQFNSVGKMVSASRACLRRHVIGASQSLRSWSLAGIYQPKLPLYLLDRISGIELEGSEAVELDRWARIG